MAFDAALFPCSRLSALFDVNTDFIHDLFIILCRLFCHTFDSCSVVPGTFLHMLHIAMRNAFF